MASRRFLIIHTAFIGDVILALPLAQVLKRRFPDAHVGFVAVPSSVPVLAHPAIDEVIPFDKRGDARGMGGVLRIARHLRTKQFDTAVIPHRSLRSALLARFACIPRRIGFTASSGRLLLTDRVAYQRELHETVRNLRLLLPLGIAEEDESPRLFPNETDRAAVDKIVREHRQANPAFRADRCIALAPGSIWATKRWPAERYALLAQLLADREYSLVLVGGPADRELCASIAASVQSGRALNTAGALPLLGSAEAIRRCLALVTNDSAPMHLAAGVQTPVVAIFGPTVPEFGFAPRGPHDAVLGVPGLPCRPCGIHGGASCPVGSFACMVGITPGQVRDAVQRVVDVSSSRIHGRDTQGQSHRT